MGVSALLQLPHLLPLTNHASFYSYYLVALEEFPVIFVEKLAISEPGNYCDKV